MKNTARPISEEIGPLVVQLIVPEVAKAVEFYKAAFGADELYRGQRDGEDRIFYSELLIGGARLLLQDEFLEYDLLSPARLGGTAVTLHLYVRDADEVHARAIAAGAKEISPVSLKFWGARTGFLQDPFGHRWIIATFVEDLSPDEILSRARTSPPEERLPTRAIRGKASE